MVLHSQESAPDPDRLSRDIATVQALPQVPLILDICSRTTGMGFTAIARVTDARWITCASLDHLGFGLKPGDELEVETTICNEVRACREVIVIDDVDRHELYQDHATPLMYGFKSYISVPIFRSDGSFFGTLCAIDPKPRSLNTPETLGMFRLYADLIALAFEQQEALAESRTALLDAQATARLREEFIAVVGHDLRSPVAAIFAGLHALQRQAQGEPTARLVRLMRDAARRMDGIISNLLDFARGRLGGGIELDIKDDVDAAELIRSIVAESAAVADQRIECRMDLPESLSCDPTRLGQLLSNLLSNAVAHGKADAPILVEAHVVGQRLQLTVTNHGEPIPMEIRDRLFHPFVRAEGQGRTGGLGLGLHIASEIAKAHDGQIEVTSDDQATRFRATLSVACRNPI